MTTSWFDPLTVAPFAVIPTRSITSPTLMPPMVAPKVEAWFSVSVAFAPLKVAVAPLAIAPPTTRSALPSILRPPVPVTALVRVSVPPEASIVPELANVVAVTVPKPLSVEPAASVSDEFAPLDVRVPPPSWIKPLLVIAALAVVQLRPASSCSSPEAPMVVSSESIATGLPAPAYLSRNWEPAPLRIRSALRVVIEVKPFTCSVEPASTS